MTKFTMRPAEMSDLESVVAFCNLWEEASAGIRSFTLDNMRSQWTRPSFNLADSTRIMLNSDSEIVGFADVQDEMDPPVKPRVAFYIHPDHEEDGLETALLDWIETRCHDCLSRLPEDLQVTIVTGTLNSFETQKQYLEKAGYTLKRHYFDMQISLDTPPIKPEWPDNITVSHYETFPELLQNLQPILAAFNEAFRDHYGHVERSMDAIVKIWTHRLNHDPDFDPTLWFIAWEGTEIAGVSLCWPKSWEDPNEGYVGVLAVRRPWRKRGLGLALLHHSFNEFYRRGKPKAGLSVDGSSLTGAVALYERAGMHVHKVYDGYEKVLRHGRDLSTREIE